MNFSNLVVIRGGGDLATGVIQKFFRSGFHVIVLETDNPTCIRRTVALSDAAYNSFMDVEDMTGVKCENVAEAYKIIGDGKIPILIDPHGHSINELKPDGVIDAILAKKNLGTNKKMAPVTIALGPGFTAGIDVDAVVETMRGHDLGRIIFSGSAIPNTGIPGTIGGQSAKRVIHAPKKGKVILYCKIGDTILKNEPIMEVDGEKIKAPFTGLVRGLIRDGFSVYEGMKIGDIDPRLDVNFHTISDKARNVGGGALEAYLALRRRLII